MRGSVLVEPPALSKVRKLGDDAFPHEYVVGLDVAVDQRLRELVVEVREAAGRTDRETMAQTYPRTRLRSEERAERAACAELEYDAQLVRPFVPHSAKKAYEVLRVTRESERVRARGYAG